MNEENNNPWENGNSNEMTDNTIYVSPSQTENAGPQNATGTENTATQNSAGNGAEPQPMPSSDNMYRFQNTNAGNHSEKSIKPKEKKDGGMKKTLLSAVVFGVVAAFCFFAIVKISGLQIGTGKGNPDEIGTVNTQSGDSDLMAVSGGAVSGVSDVSGIVENVMPSIVSITETSMQQSFFGEYPSEGAGSGFIVKQDEKELLIVTNNHVVSGADSITVKFIDDTTAKATVKGTDSAADLAVISVKLSDLKDDTKSKIKIATLGHSEDVKVGQMAIAIGNALGYGQSVTVGYISAKDREVEIGDESGNSTNKMVLLQTDAAINPGNSGGALLDANGNVIGINSVKYADTKVEGIGYAIPMSDAIPIINDLMKREVLSDEEKGYLGITGKTIGDSVSEAYGIPVGVYVSEVSETGAAKEAGIKKGDVITKINGAQVKTIEQVQNKVNNTKAGTEITVTISRSQDGEYKEQDLKVKLKDANTLNELDDSSKNSGNSGGSGSNPYGYGNDSYEDSYGGQIMPW